MSLALLFLLSVLCQASPWQEGAPVPAGGRSNPLNLTANEFEDYRRAGRLHAQFYPVEITGILVPYHPTKRLLESVNRNPLIEFLRTFFAGVTDISSFSALTAWLGLHPYPRVGDEGVYSVPFPGDQRPRHLMGLTFLERADAQGFTFSCAACHSANLFGKTVLGMSNRFPRANEFFLHGKRAQSFASPRLYSNLSGASEEETEMYVDLKQSIRRVGVVKPAALGLDTSLAQVALSLARRNKDSFATPSPHFERYPHYEPLARTRADSKPAVWWNVKFKNRFLLDGSVVSGNPIFTNLLWNEIGRGTDLVALDHWLQRNQQKIDELTTAVFSAEAPRFTDFFPASAINLASAKRGEKIFVKTCARCHGVYEKAWNLPDAENLSAADRLATTLVRYPEQTKVMNVGTDPWRALAMRSLAQLNHLSISRANNTVIRPQRGYVPPPLVGIWARWPYFHNNSAPSLCAVLTRGKNRPVYYFAGEANNPATDFDRHCNGYPSPAPKSWRKGETLFHTERAGMSRFGHDEGIFLKNGREILSEREKRDLIRFLQTL
jgi:cytochrome c553